MEPDVPTHPCIHAPRPSPAASARLLEHGADLGAAQLLVAVAVGGGKQLGGIGQGLVLGAGEGRGHARRVRTSGRRSWRQGSRLWARSGGHAAQPGWQASGPAAHQRASPSSRHRRSSPAAHQRASPSSRHRRSSPAAHQRASPSSRRGRGRLQAGGTWCVTAASPRQ